METTKIAEIEFDTWAEMARNDPDAFEAMRRAAIEDVIESAPPATQERLRRLQWRIDQERRLARTPMNACLRLSRMMWRNVLGPGGLHDRLGELHRLIGGAPGTAGCSTAEAPEPARVLAFARARD